MSQETPRDEFDAVAPLPDGRRGAHRARRSRVASLLSAGLVAGATAAVAGGAYVLLHDTADTSAPVSSTRAAGTAQDAVAPSPDAPPAPSPTDPSSGAATGTRSGTSSSGATEDAGSDGTPSQEASERSSSSSPSATATRGEVDTTLPLVVLNGTRTAGLAAKASGQLHRRGWRVQSTGNDRSGAAATTVAYRDADMAATAAAVADALGGEAVQQRGATEGVLTVVLGPDYAG